MDLSIRIFAGKLPEKVVFHAPFLIENDTKATYPDIQGLVEEVDSQGLFTLTVMTSSSVIKLLNISYFKYNGIDKLCPLYKKFFCCREELVLRIEAEDLFWEDGTLPPAPMLQGTSKRHFREHDEAMKKYWEDARKRGEGAGRKNAQSMNIILDQLTKELEIPTLEDKDYLQEHLHEIVKSIQRVSQSQY